jgi:hypothetical protein
MQCRIPFRFTSVVLVVVNVTALAFSVNVTPLLAQDHTVLPTSSDTAEVWRAAANYLRKAVGPRLLIKNGPECIPGIPLCSDSNAIVAHQHAVATATGLPEMAAPPKQTCGRYICRFDEINGVIGLGTPKFSDTTATVTVSMNIRPEGAPANSYEQDELLLSRTANGWIVTARKRLSIT